MFICHQPTGRKLIAHAQKLAKHMLCLPSVVTIDTSDMQGIVGRAFAKHIACSKLSVPYVVPNLNINSLK